MEVHPLADILALVLHHDEWALLIVAELTLAKGGVALSIARIMTRAERPFPCLMALASIATHEVVLNEDVAVEPKRSWPRRPMQTSERFAQQWPNRAPEAEKDKH
ncbi:hypothetical protein [Roseovarius arcticus]|uniref:hypothetical protein n=1 Tax=Roseovarius arcticus TaxID=2547404 RepID=UPI00111059A3|nr:hypothetical protein [Roseovarius arcticus]